MVAILVVHFYFILRTFLSHCYRILSLPIYSGKIRIKYQDSVWFIYFWMSRKASFIRDEVSPLRLSDLKGVICCWHIVSPRNGDCIQCWAKSYQAKSKWRRRDFRTRSKGTSIFDILIYTYFTSRILAPSNDLAWKTNRENRIYSKYVRFSR